jgi:hypothetical protein
LDRAAVAVNQPGVLQMYGLYQRFDLDDFVRVGARTGSNFVVLRTSRALDLPVAFRNGSFTAYRLPARFGAISAVIAEMGSHGIRVRWSGAGNQTRAQLFMEFRDADVGKTVTSTCCVPIDRPSGDVVVAVPPTLAARRFQPVIGVREIATGIDLTAGIDRAGTTRASWEYLDLQ